MAANWECGDPVLDLAGMGTPRGDPQRMPPMLAGFSPARGPCYPNLAKPPPPSGHPAGTRTSIQRGHRPSPRRPADPGADAGPGAPRGERRPRREGCGLCLPTPDPPLAPCRWPPPSTTWPSSTGSVGVTRRRSPCASAPWRSVRRSCPTRLPAPVLSGSHPSILISALHSVALA